MWSRNSIIGLSDVETVKLDFDDTSFATVKYWAQRAMKWFRLGGFVILKSSESCYHVLFNCPVSWSENMRVMAWVALQSDNRGLVKWLLMQCIKGSSTLRVSPKKEKHSPKIVFRFGKQDQEIKNYIENRCLIRKIIRKL